MAGIVTAMSIVGVRGAAVMLKNIKAGLTL
jgi:hypothetical protein